MDVKICVFLMFGYIIGCSTTKNKESFKVTLYTDLVDIIGKNETCLNKQEPKNFTLEEENLYTKQGIVISKYDFRDVNYFNAVIGKCDVIDVHLLPLHRYSWTCFATRNSSTSDPPNWFFVDCQQSSIASIQCLDVKERSIVIKHLCQKQVKDQNKTCRAFAYQVGKTALCSQRFRLKILKLPIEKPIKNNIDIEHTIAYLCIAFILTTFIITVLIPARKCKPTYMYDKQQGLRVPLEIYEMYGVSYQPSAKKKRNRKSLNMDAIPTITSHMNNVAAIANNPVDWKGYKTKFKFQHGQPLFHGLTIEAFDKIGFSSNGEGRNEKSRYNDCSRSRMSIIIGFSSNGEGRNEKSRYNDCSRSRMSIISNESVGTFDYTLFKNDDDDDNDRPIRRGRSQEKIASSDKEKNCQTLHDEHATNDENSEIVDESKGFVVDFEEDDIKRHDTGNSVCFAKDLCTFQGSETEIVQTCNCENNRFTGSMDKNMQNNDTDLIVKQENFVIERNEVTDDCISCSDDTEIHDNDYSYLLPIYEDVRERDPCLCTSVNQSDSIHDEKVTIKRMCQVTDLGEIDGYSLLSENVDVNVSKDILRPRISITLEFPKNFGLKTGTQFENNEINETNNERKGTLDIQRNVSIRNASNSRNLMNKPRKYSLC